MTFEFAETIEGFFALARGNIVSHIQIPPGAVIIDAVPSVSGGGFVGNSVNNVAKDILTTAEGGEEIGEVVADTFAGVQCSANIEVLDKGVVIIIVLEVMNDPLVKHLYLFLVGFATGTNFVSKFLCLRIP